MSEEEGEEAIALRTDSTGSGEDDKSHPKYPVGTKIRKHFDGWGWFEGMVVSHDEGFYQVLYKDGDKEEYDENELEDILWPSNQPTTKKPPPTGTKEDVTPPMRSQDGKKPFAVGTKLSKNFAKDGWVDGEIVSISNENLYRVRYENGLVEVYEPGSRYLNDVVGKR